MGYQLDSRPPVPEPIAIVGSSCRLPGGVNSPSKLWQLLKSPVDLLSEIPPSRFNPKAFYHENGEHHGSTNVTHSYLLQEDPTCFDNDFFHIHPREAEAMDPQQRLLLETVYEGIESAGLSISSLRGSDTSVFVGQMGDDYRDMLLRDVDSHPQYLGTGTSRAIMANRVSYFFDWKGPSVVIDTACSSSLVALHQAVQTLRNGESEVAVAAGVNLLLGPEMYIFESSLHMLSPTGRSRMWDSSADGYARGEGFACVVLKPLNRALADGDHIECIVRGTGVNQDGHSSGLTVPSASAQAALIKSTYARCGLDCSTPEDRCQYFEAHGTGTLAGDPKEAQGIRDAFFPLDAGSDSISSTAATPCPDKLYVGSIKTIIGHLEGTAGIAGVLKASLAVQNGFIPPNMHFNHLNPAVKPFYQNLEVPTQLKAWPPLPPGTPRRASVNSFGFGGTNAHAIIESWDGIVPPPKQIPSSTYEMIPVSATSEEGLTRALSQLNDYLRHTSGTCELDFAKFAWTLKARRTVLPHRSTFTARDTSELISQLESCIADRSSSSPRSLEVSTKATAGNNGTNPRILGIFTGQGAQWPAMGLELYKSVALFRKTVDELEEYLKTLPDGTAPTWSLKEELVAPVECSRLDSAELSQPLCTAVQIALIDLLRASRVTFSAVVGHSSGEIAAAYAAGSLSARDAIVVAYYRGYLVHRQQQSIPGRMLAVGMSFDAANEFCAENHGSFRGRLCVAAVNSPSSVTLSGDADAVVDAKALLDEKKTFARLLKVDKAYHSHHMKPVAAPYVAALKRAGVKSSTTAGRCNWYSSVRDGQPNFGVDEELEAIYWAQNMVQPVLFHQAVQTCLEHEMVRGGFNVALEVGPHPALRGPATDTIKTVLETALPYHGTLSRGSDDFKALCDSLGFLWRTLQAPLVDFAGFHRACDPAWEPPIVAKGLPPYPWMHERTLIKESKRSKAWRTRNTPKHELLGTPTTVVSNGGGHDQILRWRNIVKLSEIPWMQGHRYQGQVLFPAAGYLSMATSAVVHLAVGGPGNGVQDGVSLVELHDFQIHNAVTLDEDSSSPGVDMNLVARCLHRDRESVRVEYMCHAGNVDAAGTSGRSSSDFEKIVFAGQATVLLGEPDPHNLPPRSPCQLPLKDVNVNRFYQNMRGVGLQYSGTFTFDSLQRRRRFATVTATAIESDQYHIHPGTLDAALQSLYGAFSHPGDETLWAAYLPTKLELVRVSMAGPILKSTGSVSSSPVVVVADCHLREGSARALRGDINIFDKHGSDDQLCPFIQAQGVQFSAIEQPSAANDRKLYARNIWKADLASGVDLSGIDRHTDSAADDGISLSQICDRTAFFYLRMLCQEVADKEIAGMDTHLQAFMQWAKEQVLPMGAAASNGRLNHKWQHDTYKDIEDMGRGHPRQIDLRLLHKLGPQLSDIMRGKSSARQMLLGTDENEELLDQLYRTGLGFKESHANISAAVRQLCHRYPRMRILEVGAGTGGTTAAVLEALDGNCEAYDYTDVSPTFINNARTNLSSWDHLLRYRVLDISKSPSEQEAWVDDTGSYDLIIAANALHATPFLSQALENCRSLMRPGGFMLVLETTGPTLRLPFLFGTLPEWWLGHADGRIHGATVGEAEWHHLLQASGFSGVDRAIRDAQSEMEFTYTAMVTQATDSRVDLLRDPMSLLSSITSHGLSFQIEHIVVIGGDGLCTAKAASSISHLLRSKAKSVVVKRGVESVLPDDIPAGSAVICLSDLDRPVMTELSRQRYETVQSIFTRAEYVLWVTRGRRSTDPYASMIIALGRVAAQEDPSLRVRFLDVEHGADLDVRVLASSLLESIVLNNIDELYDDNVAEKAPKRVLWSDETEVVLEAGGFIHIPRTVPDSILNGRLGAGRRDVIRFISPTGVPLVVAHQENAGLILQEADDDDPGFDAAGGRLSELETVTIRAEYSSLSAFCEPRGKPFYVCLGRSAGTEQRVLAITPSNGSIVRAQSDQVIPIDNSGEGGQILEDILTVILCQGLLCGIDDTLWLHNASVRVSTVVSRLAAVQGAKLFQTTTTKEPIPLLIHHEGVDSFDALYVHPRTTQRELMQIIPAGVQRFVDMSSAEAGGTQFESLARACLGPGADTQTFYGDRGHKSRHNRVASSNTSRRSSTRSSRTRSVSSSRTGTRPSSPLSYSTSRLQDIIDTCGHLLDISDSMILSESTTSANSSIIRADQLDLQQSQNTATENPLAIINWAVLHSSPAKVPVKVKALDATKLFKSDRTYFLVGLAGEVGLSLCEYMIANGARHFAIASRNPRISSAMLAHLHSTASNYLSSAPVNIRVFSLDVADKSALETTHADICATMPPIAGVANGAMVLRDKSLANMTYEDFAAVLRPKVDGSKNLDEVFSTPSEGSPPLDFFVLFSSLSCIVGNLGQANYAAANMYMATLAHHRRQRGLVGSVMDIGMVLGLGILNDSSKASRSVSVMEEQLRRQDFMAISEEELHEIFAETILAGNPKNGQDPDPEIVTGLGMQVEDASWRKLARFSHFSLRIETAGAKSLPSFGSACNKDSEHQLSILEMITQAASEKEALEVLASGFSTKLALMLGIETSFNNANALDQDTALIALGIDSLVAVDIRAWFTKELNVDVPMLKILSGAVVGEICEFALRSMSGLSFTAGNGDKVMMPKKPSVDDKESSAKGQPISSDKHLSSSQINEGAAFAEREASEGTYSDAQDNSPALDSLVDACSDSGHTRLQDHSSSVSTITSPPTSPTPAGSQGFHTPASTETDDISGYSEPDLQRKDPEYERVGRMSLAQSQLYFLHEYLEDKCTYNIGYYGNIEGPLDIARLRQALNTVALRHESLRSAYRHDADSKHAVQCVLAEPRILIEHKDIPAERWEAQHQPTLSSIKTDAFDIAHGEVLKVVVLSTSSTTHQIVFSHHHIALDGLSWTIFMDDLSRAYAGQTLQSSNPLQQSIDMAEKKLETFETPEQLGTELTHWRSIYASNIPEPLPLFPFALSKCRKPLKRYEHSSAKIKFPSTFTAAIRAAAAKLHITTFHFYLATLAAFLSRSLYTEDLSIGIVDPDRPDAEDMSTIGYFLNMLPVRFDMRQGGERRTGLSFNDLALRTRDSVLAAQTHARAPFDMILDALEIPRSNSTHPLFQVVMNYRKGFRNFDTFSTPGCGEETRLEWLGGVTAGNPYDLFVNVTETKDWTLLEFITQRYLYDEGDTGMMLGWYQRALEGLARDPSLGVKECPLATEGELSAAAGLGKGVEVGEIVWEIGQEADAEASGKLYTTLIHRIDAVARASPDCVAVRDDHGAVLTYREMMARVHRIAGQLQSKLHKQLPKAAKDEQQHVAMLLEPVADTVCTMLAILRLGLVWIPLDTRNHRQRLASIVKECEPVMVICHTATETLAARLADRQDGKSILVNIDVLQGSTGEAVSAHSPNKTQSSQPAVILYTSGSTGTPKGVILQHDGLLNNICGTATQFKVKRDTILQQSPIGFDLALEQIFLALTTHSTIVMIGKQGRGDPEHISRVMKDKSVTITFFVPTEYAALLNYGAEDLKHAKEWRLAFSGGEKLTNEVRAGFKKLRAEQSRVTLVNVYGPAEISISCARGEVDFTTQRDNLFASPGYCMQICNSLTMEILPIGFAGEICIQGVGVSRGYLGREDETRLKFVDLPQSGASDPNTSTRIYRSGDLGRLLPSGSLEVLGRLDGNNQVKLRGIRIELDEIAHVVVKSSNGAVAQAAVSLRQPGDVLVALIVFDRSFHGDKEKVVDELESDLPLPTYMRPAFFVPIDEMPTTANGKRDRTTIDQLPIRAGGASQKGSSEDIQMTATEEALEKIWRDVLPATRDDTAITPDSDFFRFGGNSMVLIKLRSLIAINFGVKIALPDFFSVSTLRTMAAKIDDNASAFSSIQPIDFRAEVASLLEGLPKRGTHAATTNTHSEGLVVLLTGATGYLGTHLLRRLVANPNISEVHCIAIRPNVDGSPRPLLPELANTTAKSKIKAYPGNLSHPTLSLTASQISDLISTVDIIIHNGAEVSFLKSYHSLHNANVLATRFLAQIAIPRGIPFHFVSSARVANYVTDPTAIPLREVSVTSTNSDGGHEYIPPPEAAADGYGAAKWACEAMLESLAADETVRLPVYVHRISNIVGGNNSELDLLAVVFRYSLKMGVAPKLSKENTDGEFDMISVENCAGDLLALALRSQMETPSGPVVKFVNHCNDEWVAPEDLAGFIESSMAEKSLEKGTLKEVAYQEWLDMALKSGMHRLVYDFMSMAGADGNKLKLPMIAHGKLPP